MPTWTGEDRGRRREAGRLAQWGQTGLMVIRRGINGLLCGICSIESRVNCAALLAFSSTCGHNSKRLIDTPTGSVRNTTSGAFRARQFGPFSLSPAGFRLVLGLLGGVGRGFREGTGQRRPLSSGPDSNLNGFRRRLHFYDPFAFLQDIPSTRELSQCTWRCLFAFAGFDNKLLEFKGNFKGFRLAV